MLRVTHNRGDLVHVQVSGKLTEHDYSTNIPEVERIIAQHGPLRLLIEIEEFLGFEPAAALDDLRFDFKHRKDFKRVAVVGEGRWQEWATRLSGLLLSGEWRYFPREELGEARRWLGELEEVTAVTRPPTPA